MKAPCEVIKDLLPLYHDGVCSDESKSLVDEHLKICDSCKAELEAMDNVLPFEAAEQNLKEAETVQKLAKRWKKAMWKSVLKGALFTIAAISAILLFLYIIIDIKIVF
ncbi:MAG: zf-HC2 domain-containing protein [Eubacteriaceae bacterium]|nr:zf-HC2 domain-containing protein [Eubacteriaceae bacterium]